MRYARPTKKAVALIERARSQADALNIMHIEDKGLLEAR